MSYMSCKWHTWFPTFYEGGASSGAGAGAGCSSSAGAAPSAGAIPEINWKFLIAIGKQYSRYYFLDTC